MNSIAPAQATPLTGPSLDNKRVAAGLIDLVVLFFFGFLLGAIAGSWTPAADAVVVGWALYYYFALELLTGQTVGKKAMGLKVTTADGSEADMRAIAIRTALRLVDGIGGYLVGLIVMLASGERRQRVGDLVAGTVVTVASEAPAAADTPVAPAAPAPVAPAPPAPVSELPVAAPPAPDHTPPRRPADAPEPPPFEPFRLEGQPAAPALDANGGKAQVPPAPRQEPPAGDAGAEPRRMKIVSPIDLVMGEDDEEQRPPPPPGGGDAA